MPENPLPGIPPPQLGKYRILERLGEGGMGTVYLAFDSELGRRVALKWLKQATPATIERLRQEAHLHARVEHPAVCRLYDVDTWEGWPFLVMQHIQGETFDRVAAHLSLPTKLRLFVAIADGVHSAHRQGLIHRDLKPSNLMVEADGAGGWRPYVMDFGLAKDEVDGSLTGAGAMLGSPAYMAPEQITGGWVDARTDIYGLGAALFEVLTGRPPFLGTAADVLVQAQTSVPPRLRDLVPELPKDLEAVVEICLAQDPARRYPSAAALRDDLLRILDGEPVKARRVSRLERLALWVRRNRLVSALAGLVCLSLLGTGVVWEAGRRKAQTRAYWAERFGRDAMRMDNIVRFGRMLPPHDIARELGQVRQRLDLVRQEMARHSASRGPGHFVLGEGALLLGDEATARDEMELAWSLGYRSADVALELGISLRDLYEAEYAKTLGILDSATRKARQDGLKRDLLERSRALILQARKERGAGFSLLEEAHLAQSDRNYDEAARLAAAAYEAEAWRYEALFYQARSVAFRARELLDKGKAEAARADFEQALHLLDAAGRIGPSDARVQDAKKFVWHVGVSLHLRNLDRLASLEQALVASEALMALNSTRKDMLNSHALILAQLGGEAARQGRDPEPWFQRAEAVMRKVVDAPRAGTGAYPPLVRAKAQERLASLAHKRAAIILARKGDPAACIEAGLRICQQAEDEGLAQWETHQNRAILYLDLAEGQKNRGVERKETLEHAIRAFKACAELNPSAASWSNLAEGLNELAQRRIERDEDPGGELEAARSALGTSFSIAPGNAQALEIQKDAESIEAKWKQRGSSR
jgi:serine/threonine-protein kinase